MDYEEVIGTIGGCGLYQKLTLAFLFSATIMDGLQIGSMIFIVPDLDYRCAIPGYDNDTYKIQSEIHEELINEYIPKSEDEGEVVYDKCLIYSNTTENGNRKTQKCSSWVYDKTNTHTSITTQLNLVCDDAILARHTITIFFMGFLFAMSICGILSDSRTTDHFSADVLCEDLEDFDGHNINPVTGVRCRLSLGDCELGILRPYS
ncbi:Hypothetical predicted protein [Octopus vulgaris]|uniref:Organic cation transporter protein-like n=1 Tax=Octopus vulgaris TaxID=6645 RepID=A0AA36B7P5_OCTVU|nr:Hypothetical predicted protein [Octopus vulgaris]